MTTGLAIYFEFPVGLAESSSALIGNCIGANNVKLARRFLNLTTKSTVVVIIILSLSIGFGRYEIAGFYTTNEDVRQLGGDLLAVMSVSFFFDGMQGYF